MQPLVGIIMGSRSDWETMQHAAQTLQDLGVPHEVRVISAHRTPDALFDYASAAAERGLDSLLSMVQMPAGIPVGTLAIGKAGAINAALLATAILANKHPEFVESLAQFREKQTQAVLD